MSRLIDADAFIEYLKTCLPVAKAIGGELEQMITIMCNDFIKEVQKQPTIEAEPVRHGRWFWADDGYLRCSYCMQKAPVVPQYQDEPITTATVFCPQCGAKMDKEEA